MERVPVDSIDYQDRTFCISYPLLDDRLTASVKHFGVLSPLILLKPAPFRIVIGFKRLEAAKRMGLSEVPCSTVTMDEKQALLLAVNDNMPRSLNMVEKALCVQKMKDIGIPTDQFEAMMKIIGLQSHEKIVNLFLTLAHSDEPTQAFVALNNLGTHDVGLLLALSAQERSTLIEVLSSVRLTSSLLREIIELVRLLSIKKGSIPFEEIEGLADGDAVKNALRRIAYPLLSQLQERLKAIKETMHLPPNMSVTADPNFEKSSIDLKITGRDEGEIREAIEKLRVVTDGGHIRSIFELISGESVRN